MTTAPFELSRIISDIDFLKKTDCPCELDEFTMKLLRWHETKESEPEPELGTIGILQLYIIDVIGWASAKIRLPITVVASKPKGCVLWIWEIGKVYSDGSESEIYEIEMAFTPIAAYTDLLHAVCDILRKQND